MKIQIIPSKGQWYWRVVSGNRKILCHSEKYKRRRDAVHAAKLVCAGAKGLEIEIVDLSAKR